MLHQEGDFPGCEGLSIYWQSWMPSAADALSACVLIAHGLGEHGGRYRHVAEYLLTNGYGTMTSCSGTLHRWGGTTSE